MNWPQDTGAPQLYLNVFHPEHDDLFMLGMVEASGLGWQGRDEQAELVSMLAQFVLLPALTCLACWALAIEAQLALAMTLIAACPGGSFSNIMTWMARGNVALSVSMTAVSSVVASVLTPLNFALYAWLNPHTRPLLTQIELDPLSLLLLVLLVLGLPLLAGIGSAGASRY